RQLARPVRQRAVHLESAVSEAERALADALDELAGLHAAQDAYGEALRAARRAGAAREADLATARRRLADAAERTAREQVEADRAVARRDELEADGEIAQRALAAAVEAERAADLERGRLRV